MSGVSTPTWGVNAAIVAQCLGVTAPYSFTWRHTSPVRRCVTNVRKGGEEGEERRLLMFSLILMLMNSLFYPFVLLFG